MIEALLPEFGSCVGLVFPYEIAQQHDAIAAHCAERTTVQEKFECGVDDVCMQCYDELDDGNKLDSPGVMGAGKGKAIKQKLKSHRAAPSRAVPRQFYVWV